jgi:hypothetical protein
MTSGARFGVRSSATCPLYLLVFLLEEEDSLLDFFAKVGCNGGPSSRSAELPLLLQLLLVCLLPDFLLEAFSPLFLFPAAAVWFGGAICAAELKLLGFLLMLRDRSTRGSESSAATVPERRLVMTTDLSIIKVRNK